MVDFSVFAITPHSKLTIARPERDIIVVDGFYERPRDVRAFALSREFSVHTSIYDSYWTPSLFDAHQPMIDAFQEILGVEITAWRHPSRTTANGSFQYVTRETGPVIHADGVTRYGGVLYLTPDPPAHSGIGFFRHNDSGLLRTPTAADFERIGRERLELYRQRDQWRGGEAPRLDAWALVCEVPNVFNRLVLFAGDRFHSGLGGFGTTKDDARLYQTFFFS